jgi:hypothetical protein
MRLSMFDFIERFGEPLCVYIRHQFCAMASGIQHSILDTLSAKLPNSDIIM